MLSTTPASFNFNEVKVKEFDEMSTLEQVLFDEFIFKAYGQMESRRVKWAPRNADELMIVLRREFADVPRWVVRSGENFAGLLILIEDEALQGFRFETYVAPEFISGHIDVAMMEIAQRLAKESSARIYYAIDLNCEIQINALHKFIHEVPTIGNVVNCDDFNKDAETGLNEAYERIRQAYVS